MWNSAIQHAFIHLYLYEMEKIQHAIVISFQPSKSKPQIHFQCFKFSCYTTMDHKKKWMNMQSLWIQKEDLCSDRKEFVGNPPKSMENLNQS